MCLLIGNLKISPVLFPSPRELASICHSFASSDHFRPIPELFIQKIEEANMIEYSAQGIATTAWPFTKLRRKALIFFEKVAADMGTRDISTFKPVDVASIT